MLYLLGQAKGVAREPGVQPPDSAAIGNVQVGDVDATETHAQPY